MFSNFPAAVTTKVQISCRGAKAGTLLPLELQRPRAFCDVPGRKVVPLAMGVLGVEFDDFSGARLVRFFLAKMDARRRSEVKVLLCADKGEAGHIAGAFSSEQLRHHGKHGACMGELCTMTHATETEVGETVYRRITH